MNEKEESSIATPRASGKLALQTKENYILRIRAYLRRVGMSPDQFVRSVHENPKVFEEDFVKFISEVSKSSATSTTAFWRDSLRRFLEINRVKGIDWDYVNQFLPKVKKSGQDRAPTLEEIRKVVTVADLRTKCLVLFLTSSGARIGSIEYLRWRDIQEVELEEWKLAKVTIYRGEPEEYDTFVSPECYEYLLKYREIREKVGEVVAPSSPVFVREVNKRRFDQSKVRPVGVRTLKNQMGELLNQMKMREKLSDTKNYRSYEWKQCVTPETYIMDNPNMVLAADIERLPLESLHPLAHSGRFETATTKFSRHYRGKVVEIYPYFTNIPTRLTPDHPVLCRPLEYRLPNRREQFVGLGKPRWVAAKEIVAKWVAVAYPRIKDWESPTRLDIKELTKEENFVESNGKLASRQGQRKWIPGEVPLTPGLMKVFGFYLAEGSVEDGHTIHFSFGLHEKYDSEVGRLCNEIFDVDSKIHYMKQAKDLRVDSTVLAKAFTALFATGAGKKRIPTWFLSLPPSLLWPLLEGCMRGDGNIDTEFSPRRHTRVRITATISRTLAEQLRHVVHRLGVPCSLRRYDGTHRRTVIKSRHPIHYVEVGSSFSHLVRGELGLDFEIPPPSPWNREKRHQAWVDDDYVWIAVRRIEQRSFSGQVFNLEVFPSNSFTANGFVVHNCHSFRKFFKTRMEMSGVKPIITEMLMGHTVGVANSYMKPTQEELASEYVKAIPNLTIVGAMGEKADKNVEFKREILLKVGGYSKEEVEKLSLADMEDAEVQRLVKERFLGAMANNGGRQKVVPLSEIETYLTQGWEYVAALPNEKAVLKLPN